MQFVYLVESPLAVLKNLKIFVILSRFSVELLQIPN
jgi:hypothetical protein